MQRSPYKSTDRYYNQQASLNIPLLCYRRAVMPGQTLDIGAQIRMRSAALNLNIGKVVHTTNFFYVPNRLLWDGWIDYITDETGTFPACNTADAKMFEDTISNLNPFFRRAYKFIYNEYYGDEKIITPYDVDDDTVATHTKPVLTLEQRFRGLQQASNFPAAEYVAPVVGADATINHGDFSRSASEARRDFRFEKSGNKYVDFLRQFGANPEFNEQVAPEYLGGSTRDISARVQAASDGANLGALRSYYASDKTVRTGKKRFEEHGVVLGLTFLRPVLFQEDLLPADARMRSADEFFRGNNVNVPLNLSEIGGTSEDMLVPPNWRYTAGQHLSNNNGQADMIFTQNTLTGDDMRYRLSSPTVAESTLGTDAWAVFCETRNEGVMPASGSLTF